MKFIIYWDAGQGRTSAVVEAASEEEANDYAYQAWREDAEQAADYGVGEYSEENWEGVK